MCTKRSRMVTYLEYISIILTTTITTKEVMVTIIAKVAVVMINMITKIRITITVTQKTTTTTMTSDYQDTNKKQLETIVLRWK